MRSCRCRDSHSEPETLWGHECEGQARSWGSHESWRSAPPACVHAALRLGTCRSERYRVNAPGYCGCVFCIIERQPPRPAALYTGLFGMNERQLRLPGR